MPQPPAVDSSEPTLSIAAGDATQTSAVLWARSNVAGPVLFRYGTQRDINLASQVITAYVIDPLVPVKVTIDDLTPLTTYYYAASNARETRSGRFTTPAAPGRRVGLRFGVSGDWRGELRPYPAIANLPGRELDFFVALGDTIYADYPSPAVDLPQCQTLEDFRRKHAEVYSPRFGVDSWNAARGETTWYCMADDHEVTNDYAGGAPPATDARFDRTGQLINQTNLYRNGLQAFIEFNPAREEYYDQTGDPRTAGGRKLYRFRTFGDDAALFLLDARSFRDTEIAGPTGPGELGAAPEFFQQAFTPGRTLLGARQLADLKSDLLRAQAAGVTWKFVLVPEPIQNLGPLLGQDRFEGYAAERSELLDFIAEAALENVVFVSADVHCTIVNNLTYQPGPGQPQLPTRCWEITTGSVAFAAPFGPTAAEVMAAQPVAGPLFGLLYHALDRAGRDELLTGVMNALLAAWGYDPVGLDDSPIPAQLLQGRWASLHTYGWTEFEIDAATQALTVTTYGIDWYDEAALRFPYTVSGRAPQVVSRFVVAPASATFPVDSP